MNKIVVVGFLLAFVTNSMAQTVTPEDDLAGRTGRNIISTPVSFLTISPDSRSAALGDAGVASSPDANSNYWNAAKLAFMEDDMGASLSYAPWLRKLVNDMSLSYLSGYKKIRKEEAVGVYLSYFNLGQMEFRDENNTSLGFRKPYELAVGGNYARKLSRNLSVSLGLKYIYSNLTGGVDISTNGVTTQTKPGQSAAADIGVYYTNEVVMGGRIFELGLGGQISNLGGKLSYTNNGEGDFIPTNLRLGTSLTTEIDAYNKITFLLDFNKLMVPTPPIYDRTTGDLEAGKDPNRNFISGVFGSFADAPGGFSEELKEIMISTGVEYWYTDFLAARAGYFYESNLKGNRKYFTVGLGLIYNQLGFDFAYLIPRGRSNPLQDTLRFTLTYNVKSKSPVDTDSIEN